MKIFSYQGTPVAKDIHANLATIRHTAAAATALNIDVIVFPELFVTGYNIGDAVKTLAEPIDGFIVSSLRTIAKQHHVAIVCGFPEKASELLFNSAIAISKSGNIVGHHHKVFLFGDREKVLFTPGAKFTSFDLDGVHCGLSICYDIEFPETCRDLAHQGARVIFNPTANMQPYIEVPLTLARARALENGVVVVYANLSGEEDGLFYTGLSGIIGPDGKDIARAGEGETTLICTLDKSILSPNPQLFSTQLSDLYHSTYYRAKQTLND